MTENLSLDQYKKRVNDLGQALLDAIASVSLGNFNVDIQIPEDIEVLADLGVGLEFMIEDLRELAKQQEQARFELEQRVQQRTRELENALKELQSTQRQVVNEGWQEYTAAEPRRFSLLHEKGQERPGEAWLPGMEKAVEQAGATLHANGDNQATLALPIRLQDEVIGVVGFNREDGQPWDERQIATVEAIMEQVGLALENQRLFDRTQAALSEADTLYQASAELNTAQSYEDILRVLKKYTAVGQRAHGLIVGYFEKTWNRENPPENIFILGALTDEPIDVLTDYSIDTLPTVWDIVRPNEITFVDDVRGHPQLDAATKYVYLKKFHANAAGFLPLLVGGRWVGTVAVLFKQSMVFSPEELRRARAILDQASVAVQNLRNLELAEQRALEAQRRSEELALINRIVSSVAATMDLRQSLDFVARELNRALTGVDEIGIALLNESRTELQVIADSTSSASAKSSVGLRLPVKGNPSTQQVINTMKPVIVQQPISSPETAAIQDVMAERGYQNLVIFPLVATNEVIGTVGAAMLTERGRLSEDDMRLAETIILQASTAIQNARLFEQTQQALTETANLYRASAELNAVQSFDDVLIVLRRYTILGQNANHVALAMFDQPWVGDTLPSVITPVAVWSRRGDASDSVAPLSTAGWEKVFSNAQRVELSLFSDLSGLDEINAALHQVFPHDHKDEALLVAPLLTAGQCIGLILGAYPAQTQLTEEQRRRAMALAGQAAVAIQNLQLLEETQRRARQLETAAEIARESSGTLELENLLDRAINLIRDRFGYYYVSILLAEGDQVVVRAATGDPGRALKEQGAALPIEPGTSIIGTVAYSGKTLLVNDVSQDPTHQAHPLLPETKAELGLPLKSGNRITGVLDVQADHINAFTPDDVAVLQILADQLSVAAENARAFSLVQQAVEDLREIDRVKTEFLSNMSHELRTPLNSIIGFSRVILKGIDGPVNDLQRQDLEAIHNSGQHLLDMINDILDLSRIEAGKMEITPEELDLNEVIASVMSTASGLIKEKPLQLVNQVPANLPKVLADRTRTRQILINLISNAVKFTDEGRIQVSAVVIPRPADGLPPHIRVDVKDSGIGIPAEKMHVLFERFSQVDASPTRKTGGTGLGLSITRHLVELQGGQIGVESRPGSGSTFWFTTPLAGSPPVTAGLPAAPAAQEPPPAPGARIILAVDDDPKVISLYQRYLGSHGFQVLPVTDSQQAVEQARSLRPYAITLDIQMPGRDGWAVITELKRHPETRDIPVVICSILDERQRALDLGAAGYLTKPILEEEFVNAIDRLHTNGDRRVQNVLVVDDDPNVVSLLERAARGQSGLRFRYAENGLLGLNSIQSARPDLILLDLFMPDLDGFSLLEAIHSDPDLRTIPVIIITGAELGEEDVKRLQRYQRQLMLKSQIEGTELLASLERAIAQPDH
ncbi:MAG: GAF domain-containing protein [Chloroflexi bacterium]|nr:GAF domain-containing protein [Chloroflexota bacterium]